MIGEGEVLAAGSVSERAGQPALADAGGPDQQEAVVWPDPVAVGELQEEIAIEAAGGAEVDVLDLGVMAQPRGARSRLEALLPARGRLAFEQQRKPFAMLEVSRFRLRLEFLIGAGHVCQAEVAQHVDGGLVSIIRCLLNGSSRGHADWRVP